MDLTQALIGAGATNPAEQAALAAQLRNRSRYGQLGLLTGDKPMAAVGGQLIDDANAGTQMLQGIRQKDIDNKQAADALAFEKDYKAKALSQAWRIARMQDARMRELAGMRMAGNQAGKSYPRLTMADRKRLEGASNVMTDVGELLANFKPEYAQRLGPGPQSRLPNALASYGVGTQGSKEAAQWWASWNQLYSLGQRNQLFGATLTPNEMQAWAQSDINPSMSPDQIKERVGNIAGILQKHADKIDRTYKSQFDPDIIDEYGLASPQGGAGAGGTPAMGAPAGAAPSAPQAATQGSKPDYTQLSDDQLAEMLQQLIAE